MAELPTYGGTIVSLDARGRIISRSQLRFRPATVSLAPPVGHSGEPVGVYVGGFHGQDARFLAPIIFPKRFERFEMEPIFDWSPQSDAVLFSFQGTVSVIDLKTGLPRKIADGAAAQWSPSGDLISYLTVRSEAAILNLATGRTEMIDPGKQVGYPMEWSPDGKYLLITEGRGSHVYNGCLWVYRISDRSWFPLPNYGIDGLQWHWIQL